MSGLHASDFPAFLHEVYGYRPYPWQSRLATQVVETGEWPELLDLPTGTGKTAALDIALFALAARGDLPRRIVFVVDRRIVVHQAARRVQDLVTGLDPAGSGVAAEVARRLRSLAPSPPGVDDGPVVRWSELRGGIVRDESWATRPDVPAVLVSTVDQVGSRLLFRGYGVSRGMRPVHAGLLGADTLFLLDEVHLARPFRTTLRAIGSRYRGGDGTAVLPDRWRVVELSATASDQVERPFTIIDDDRQAESPEDALAVAELERRLGASKPAVLRAVKAPAKPGVFGKAIADACLVEVRTLLDAGTRRIGVVVNRVATAAAVERAVQALGHDVILVTGRIRPIDREVIVRRLETRAGADRVRRGDDRPVVVVATQAIEAGADLDLDALVTECASLDALRQRFGRVDRGGVMSAAGLSATSVVLGGSGAVQAGTEDPVYGSALAATWAWLKSVATDGAVDFGTEQLAVPVGAGRDALLPPRPWCPQLFPSQLDRWVQTSTEPDADPVVAHWLHGLEERPVDVSVIWRADITTDLLRSMVSDSVTDDEPAPSPPVTLLDDLFESCPPDAREAMGLPVRAVRQWLVALGSGETLASSEEVIDVATQADAGGDGRSSERIAPVVLIGSDGGPGDSEILDRQSGIRPGVTVVVPLGYGGIRSGSWDPTETAAVADRATAARALADRRAVLRLFAGGITLPAGSEGGSNEELAYPVPTEEDDESDPTSVATDDDEAVIGWLDAYLGAVARELSGASPDREAPSALEVAVVRHLSAGQRRVRRITRPGPNRITSTSFIVSRARLLPLRLLGTTTAEQAAAAVDSEPETSSFVGREVALSVHLSDVRQWGEVLATNVGLPPDIVADISLAGWFHDLGKADPRFQLMLRQGAIGASADLLAKSGLAPGDRAARREARRTSGYPRGGRHELLSLALVQGCGQLMSLANDPDLVMHLIASHHGHCRPFAPVILDDRPVEVIVDHGGVRLEASSNHGLARLDAGVPERFWRLVRRYGWWDLAWLETLLRLADHRASEFEQLQNDSESEESG